VLLGCGILVPLCPTPEIAQGGAYIETPHVLKIHATFLTFIYCLIGYPEFPMNQEKLGLALLLHSRHLKLLVCGCQCEAGTLGRTVKILPVLAEPSAKDIADIPGCREKDRIMRELTLTFFVLSHWTWKC
jgi:hypothetical protein